jgi:hypothetical protein
LTRIRTDPPWRNLHQFGVNREHRLVADVLHASG